MVVVEFPTKELVANAKQSKEKIIATLTEIGAPCFEDGENIILELTPNRPDWYSMEGVIRTLNAYYKNEINEYNAKKSDYHVTVDPSVKTIRPFTVCAVVKGIIFTDQRIREIVRLQEKLVGTLGRNAKKFGIGVYPLQAIEFPIKYTTMKKEEIQYVPLGYDKEMTAEEILTIHKKGKEHGHILKDAKKYPVFLDAKNQIMCLIPIVNSAKTGKVDLETKDIFIEVSGITIDSVLAALNIFCCACADMGGTIYEVAVKYNKKTIHCPKLKTKDMKISKKYVEKVLGIKLTNQKIKELLTKMGYHMVNETIQIPPYRADIMGPIDLVEDIAIAYGYNNFEPQIPEIYTEAKSIEDYAKIDETIRGMGFLEVKTFLLTDKSSINKINYNGSLIEVLNPACTEFTVLRPSLIGKMLDIFGENKMKGLPQKIYEIGYVYEEGNMKKKLAFAIMDKQTNFSECRGYLQTLLKESEIEFELISGTTGWLDKLEGGKIVLKKENILKLLKQKKNL
ncbi:MAG: phenylalanine--tRNA ligase subunit beta, partial [Candidatus Micrarchaeota archaeon]